MVDLLELKKEEFLNNRFETYNKLGITKEELNKDYEEVYNDFLDKGFSEEDSEYQTKKRIIARYSKIERLPAGSKFEGVFVSVTLKDYGAQKNWDKAMEEYNKDPEQAKRKGYIKIDSDGNELLDSSGNIIPLYVDLSGKKGEEIKIELSKQVIGISKKEGDENFRKAILNLTRGKENLKVPLYTLVEFSANPAAKSTAEEYFLYSSADCVFKEKTILEQKDIEELLSAFFKDQIIKMSDLKAYHDLHKSEWNRLVFTKGDVSNIFKSKEGKKTNGVILTDVNGEVTTLRINLFKYPELEINFSQNTNDLIVCGQTTEDPQTGEISLFGSGFYANKIYKIEPAKTLPNGED